MESIQRLKNHPELVPEAVEFFFDFKPHSYQRQFLRACFTKNRIASKWCRQAGKSQIVSVYTLLRALMEPTTIIIVAPTQSQSSELFSKIRDMANKKGYIRRLIDRNNATEMIFKNGSRIISLPCGPFGSTIRGYTCDVLVIEESGIMKDDIVNTVLVPMLASKGIKGQIIKIGTPLTRNHFYRSCFDDDAYEVINVTWRECLEEGQYDKDFVEEQRAQLTDIQFRTEYEADFVDDNLAFFPVSLLDRCKNDYGMFPPL